MIVFVQFFMSRDHSEEETNQRPQFDMTQSLMAPEFVPSTSAPISETPATRKRTRDRRRVQESTMSSRARPLNPPPAPVDESLRASLTIRLTNQTYECMICYENVRKRDATWSCDQCWAVFHSSCIQQWAEKSTSHETLHGKQVPELKWRCPGCQYMRTAKPRGYYCFCTKVDEPEAQRFVTPHSCGEVCGRSLALRAQIAAYKCPHRCTLLCHPGPCDPCSAMAPQNMCRCFCGKQTTPLKCSDLTHLDSINSKQVRSCGQSCGKKLNCKKHTCDQPCHSGSCQPCERQQFQGCLCGQSIKSIGCAASPSKKRFQCDKNCGKMFQCGVHRCKLQCHRDEGHMKCPFDPLLVKTCWCAKKSVFQCLGRGRADCTEPIPSCGQACGKQVKLRCGHMGACIKTCHEGECEYAPCEQTLNVKCVCGSKSIQIACSLLNDPESRFIEHPNQHAVMAFRCTKVCGERMDCIRHRCQQQCCDMQQHPCQQTCGKPLPCRNHVCELRCYKGKCEPCLRVIDNPIACHCGRTVLPAPFMCGAKLPDCPFPCERRRPCGHDEVIRFSGNALLSHNCHPDDVKCNPCLVQVEKLCLCTKTKMRSRCSQDARCANICGKVLECGNPNHTCKRGCHDGVCLDVGKCTQTCNISLACGHPCPRSCHGNSICSTDEPCLVPIQQQCPCGNRVVKTKCFNRQSMECSNDCVRKQRNARLSAAFNIIQDPIAEMKQCPFSPALLTAVKINFKFAQFMETELQKFLDDDKEVVNYPPVRNNFRHLMLLLIEENYVGLVANVQDYGANRSVNVRKLPTARPPRILVSKYVEDCVRRGIKDFSEEDPTSMMASLNFGGMVLKKRVACALDHRHLSGARPGHLEHILNRVSLPSMQELDGDVPTDAKHSALRALMKNSTRAYSVPIPTITCIRLKTLDSPKVATSLLADFLEGVRDELAHLNTYQCTCACPGCFLFPNASLVARPGGGVEDQWAPPTFTPKELYIAASHIALSEFKILDENGSWEVLFKPSSLQPEGAEVDDSYVSKAASGKWTRKLPKEPLNSQVSSWLLWMAATVLQNSSSVGASGISILLSDTQKEENCTSEYLLDRLVERVEAARSYSNIVPVPSNALKSTGINPFDLLSS